MIYQVPEENTVTERSEKNKRKKKRTRSGEKLYFAEVCPGGFSVGEREAQTGAAKQRRTCIWSGDVNAEAPERPDRRLSA